MTDNLQERYFELFDHWKNCKAEVDELQSEVTKAFSEIARGTGNNPSEAVLLTLDCLRDRQQRLWDEMQRLLEERTGF